MNIHLIRETSRGTECIIPADHLFQQRKIFFQEKVTTDSAMELLHLLMCAEDEAPGEPVTLYLASPGGDVSSGLFIYDYIQSMRSPVDTVCIGTAASMGAILFLAGRHRTIWPHARLMLHDPSFAGGELSGLKPGELRDKLNDLRKVQRTLVELIEERTGLSKKEIYAITAEDTYFTAREALEKGLATALAGLPATPETVAPMVLPESEKYCPGA